MKQIKVHGYSSLMSLNELFEGRFFYIPDYQRGYSWEKQQLEDLTQDIVNMINKQHIHFTGTIVAAQKNKKVNTFEIVDGQQRLTTLIILIKEIINQHNDKYGHLIEKFIQRGNDRNPKNVFVPNKETRECFDDVIIQNDDGKFVSEIKSHECIINARNYFRRWISVNTDKIDQITDIIIEKMGFLLYTPATDKEIGIMFEVINNRGKELSELEKIKNYFIYYSTVNGLGKLRQTVNDKWISIQKNLSQAGKTDNEDENSFLRNCYLVFFNPRKTKRDVYNQLKVRFDVTKKDKQSIDKHLEEMGRFVKFLTDSSRYYAYFFNENFFNSYFKDKHKSDISVSLKYLRSQPTNASIMPLYLSIMQRQDELDDVSELLSILEKVNFRLYILPGVLSRADTKQGDMFALAHHFFHEDYKKENGEFDYAWYNEDIVIKGTVFDWLKIQLIELTKHYCYEEKFVQVLTIDNDEDYNYYHWQGVRYFLACFEEWLQKKAKQSWDVQRILAGRKTVKHNFNDHLSIEHIWASANRKDEFDHRFKEKRRLGNFILLGLIKNIQLSDDDIPDKINDLSKHNTSSTGALNLHQVAKIIRINEKAERYLKVVRRWKLRRKNYWKDLSMKINDIRETELIKFALERWELPDETFNRFIKVDSFNANKNKLNNNYIMKKKSH